MLAVIGFTYLVARALGRRTRGYRGAIPAWQRALPVALLAGALVCVGLAVFQFRVNEEAVQGTVILTLDVSNSMDETDVVSHPAWPRRRMPSGASSTRSRRVSRWAS